MAIFRRGPPLTGASNAGGGGTNRKSGRTTCYRSMTAAVRTTTATVDGAVYRTERHALVYHNQQGRPRRREENKTEFNCTQQ